MLLSLSILKCRCHRLEAMYVSITMPHVITVLLSEDDRNTNEYFVVVATIPLTLLLL